MISHFVSGCIFFGFLTVAAHFLNFGGLLAINSSCSLPLLLFCLGLNGSASLYSSAPRPFPTFILFG